jgi:nitroreductase
LELKDVIARRRMCRSFLEGPIDPVALERALETATHAPSAGNTQGWAFVVREDP